MLYSAIKCVTAAVFFVLGQHTMNGAYIVPTITNKQDIECGIGSSNLDTCYIDCDQNDPQIPNVYCRNVGNCTINCSDDWCLWNANIYASNATNLHFTSTAKACVEAANIYLPNNGNATIIGDTLGTTSDVFKKVTIHSGTATNHIHIECNDSSNDSDIKNECTAININASTANYLDVVINNSEFQSDEKKSQNPIIHCPINSKLSPSCIINANNADSTRFMEIYAPQGMPKGVMFLSNGNGDYTGTTITCSKGISTIQSGNTFIGTPCYITPEPTKYPTSDPSFDPTSDPTTDPTDDPSFDPTIDPTVDPTEDPTIDPTIKPTINPTNDPTKDPTKYPSKDPTTDPTFDPTVNPTHDPTMEPTVKPTTTPSAATNGPSNMPTNNPSITTGSPTKYPSTSPTIIEAAVDGNMETTINTVSIENKEKNMLFGIPSVSALIIIILCIFIGILLCFICVFILRKKNNKKKIRKKTEGPILIEMNSPSTTDEKISNKRMLRIVPSTSASPRPNRGKTDIGIDPYGQIMRRKQIDNKFTIGGNKEMYSDDIQIYDDDDDLLMADITLGGDEHDEPHKNEGTEDNEENEESSTLSLAINDNHDKPTKTLGENKIDENDSDDTESSSSFNPKPQNLTDIGDLVIGAEPYVD